MNDAFNTAENLLVHHAGILRHGDFYRRFNESRILVNGSVLDDHGRLLREADRLDIDGEKYRLVQGGENRLQIVGDPPAAGPVPGLTRLHCGLHKCLTMYQRKIYTSSFLADRLVKLKWSRPRYKEYNHYYHRKDVLLQRAARHCVNSISGQCLDLNQFEDARVVRVIRDPRDLLVSGYHYHRRGAEHWSCLANPSDVDWMMVNGKVPGGLRDGESFSEFLQRSDLETGLLAEIEFRQYHFESMRNWPDDHRIRVWRYEDILGQEARVFPEIFRFLELGKWLQFMAGKNAEKYRSGGRAQARKGHIRNSSSGQWQDCFSDKVTSIFNERHGDILERHGFA